MGDRGGGRELVELQSSKLSHGSSMGSLLSWKGSWLVVVGL